MHLLVNRNVIVGSIMAPSPASPSEKFLKDALAVWISYYAYLLHNTFIIATLTHLCAAHFQNSMFFPEKNKSLDAICRRSKHRTRSRLPPLERHGSPLSFRHKNSRLGIKNASHFCPPKNSFKMLEKSTIRH